MELVGTDSMFGVFNAHNNEQLNTFSGDASNPLKGMAFSPNSRQVALMYHYGTMQNRVRLVWGLPFMPSYTCLPIGYTYYHYMVYWTGTYLAFSYAGSNVDAVLSTLPSTYDCSVWMNEGKGESQER